MPNKRKCKNCEYSGHYINDFVCWLFSDDEVYYLEDESEACPEYEEREDNTGEETEDE